MVSSYEKYLRKVRRPLITNHGFGRDLNETPDELDGLSYLIDVGSDSKESDFSSKVRTSVYKEFVQNKKSIQLGPFGLISIGLTPPVDRGIVDEVSFEDDVDHVISVGEVTKGLSDVSSVSLSGNSTVKDELSGSVARNDDSGLVVPRIDESPWSILFDLTDEVVEVRVVVDESPWSVLFDLTDEVVNTVSGVSSEGYPHTDGGDDDYSDEFEEEPEWGNEEDEDRPSWDNEGADEYEDEPEPNWGDDSDEYEDDPEPEWGDDEEEYDDEPDCGSEDEEEEYDDEPDWGNEDNDDLPPSSSQKHKASSELRQIDKSKGYKKSHNDIVTEKTIQFGSSIIDKFTKKFERGKNGD